MYNISLKNLLENQLQRLEWESTPAHRELCTLKGKQDSDCQNYIRVFARIDDNKIMVCGTNSYKPLCRRYKNGPSNTLSSSSHEDDTFEIDTQSTTSDSIIAAESSAVAAASSTESDSSSASASASASSVKNLSGEFELIEEFDGQGRCPYNPTHNSSYIFTGTIEEFFSQNFRNQPKFWKLKYFLFLLFIDRWSTLFGNCCRFFRR